MKEIKWITTYLNYIKNLKLLDNESAKKYYFLIENLDDIKKYVHT